MVVVGASNIVGKPMALMLMQRDATVCICHAKTRDLAQFTILADILVVAAGRPNLILAEGFQSALRRFKRLRQMGDRMQSALPGAPERWGMLAPLRVTLPTNAGMVPLEAVRAAS